MKVITLARKPLAEGTVVNNVIEHGTGAINIDRCRIRSASMPAPTTAPGWDSYNAGNQKQGYRSKDYSQGPAEYHPNSHGRFPTNLVLEHLPGCRSLGPVRVEGRGARKSSIGQGREGNHTNGIYGAKQSKVTTAYVDEDGTEMVEGWECAPGCPVAVLDQEVGHLPSRGNTGRERTGGGMFGHGEFVRSVPLTYDSGGASRFFKQVQSETGE